MLPNTMRTTICLILDRGWPGKTHYTLIKFSVQRKVAEANYLSFGTFASELSKGDTTGREPDDRVVVRGTRCQWPEHMEGPVISLLLGALLSPCQQPEVFSCACVASSAWDGPLPSYKIGALTTGQKYDAEYDVADDLDRRFFF